MQHFPKKLYIVIDKKTGKKLRSCNKTIFSSKAHIRTSGLVYWIASGKAQILSLDLRGLQAQDEDLHD